MIKMCCPNRCADEEEEDIADELPWDEAAEMINVMRPPASYEMENNEEYKEYAKHMQAGQDAEAAGAVTRGVLLVSPRARDEKRTCKDRHMRPRAQDFAAPLKHFR